MAIDVKRVTCLTLSLPTGGVYPSYTYCYLFATMTGFYIALYPIGSQDYFRSSHDVLFFYQVYNKNSQNWPWLMGIYHMKLYVSKRRMVTQFITCCDFRFVFI